MAVATNMDPRILDPELQRQFRAFTRAMHQANDVDMKYLWKLKRDDVVRREKEKEQTDALPKSR